MSDFESRENPYNATQASRIYFLPNLMTAGNLFCGFVAVINCIQARLAETIPTGEYLGRSSADLYRNAVWFILGAVVFDSLDGRLARLGGRESLFVAEFDSLADVVSFCLATEHIMFFLILSPTHGYPMFQQIGWFLGFIYLFAFSIGMCALLVVVGIFGATFARLPKSGMWMVWVKRVLALVMLGAAEYYFVHAGLTM